MYDFIMRDQKAWNTADAEAAAHREDALSIQRRTITDLPLSDEQAKAVLEWYAHKIWCVDLEFGADDGRKTDDPLTIGTNTASTTVLDLGANEGFSYPFYGLLALETRLDHARERVVERIIEDAEPDRLVARPTPPAPPAAECLFGFEPEDEAAWRAVNEEAAAFRADTPSIVRGTIDSLPLSREQKEAVLEWYAFKIWLLEGPPEETGGHKSYDPLTIDNEKRRAHSYVLSLDKCGGRTYDYHDLKDLEATLDREHRDQVEWRVDMLLAPAQ